MSVLRSKVAAVSARFVEDRSGVVAIIFGLSLLPLVLAVGVAVDYSRAGATKNRLQGAADTAALALAHEAGKLDQESLNAKARTLVEANFGSVQGASVVVVSAVEGDGEITVTAEADVPTTFAGLMDMEQIPVTVSSNAVWGGNPIELALVLDTTASMNSDQKLKTLKEAVHEMLDVLDDPTAVAEGAINIGIVPFTTQVRVPTSNANAAWVRDYNGFSDALNRHDLLGALSWLGYSSSNWKGCLFDRDQPHDASDAAATDSATRYPKGPCVSNSLAEILPLTNDFGTLRNTIDALVADGNTNVTIGVSWGMTMLSRQAPLSQATAPGDVDGLKKIMIVLTDGENTMNRVSRDTDAIDARTRAACQSAKDAGLEIFTIRVLEGNQDLLRNCATDPSHYFNVENVSDLLPAFEAITTKISELRIAR